MRGAHLWAPDREALDPLQIASGQAVADPEHDLVLARGVGQGDAVEAQQAPSELGRIASCPRSAASGHQRVAARSRR